MRFAVAGRLLIGCLAGLAAAPAGAQEMPLVAQDIGERVADAFARPAADAFLDGAETANEVVGGLCAAPSPDALAAARDAFSDLVTDWGRLSVVRFGPVAAENRFERVFFWPDPRGVILRQVQGALGDEDPAVASADSLAGKSVALQGLPALEFLLFGGGSEELAGAAGFRCGYAHAIAGNLAAIATDIALGWEDGTAFAASFTAPAADRDPYRSTGEVAGEVVEAMSTTLQFVRMSELQPAMGESAAEARGKRAPLWRSGLTFDLAVAQVDAVHALEVAAGFEDAGTEVSRGLAGSIRFELVNAARALGQVTAPPEEAFGTEPDRGKIDYALIALDGAGHTLGETFSGAIGLTMGFNALDGD